MVITIVNYGLGNIKAFYNIYKSLNIKVKIASNAAQLLNSDKIILPGVGSFDWALERLNKSGMIETLNYLVLEKKIPILGVCVGMQIMAETSEEGQLKGLGWINANVSKIKKEFLKSKVTQDLILPHMGWNDINLKKDSPLFKGLSKSQYYFLHSYCFSSLFDNSTLTTTNYGQEFISSFSLKNIYGVQFHPEKSHDWGIKLLKNFSDI